MNKNVELDLKPISPHKLLQYLHHVSYVSKKKLFFFLLDLFFCKSAHKQLQLPHSRVICNVQDTRLQN